MGALFTPGVSVELRRFKSNKSHGQAIIVTKEYVGVRDWVNDADTPISFIFSHPRE
jgi:hypothetical protein